MNSYTLAAQNMTGQNKSSFKPTKIWSGLSDHVRCAFFIVMLTIIWAAAALIISEIHPDAKTGSKNAAGVYFNHIVKNNTIILYIGGILYLFKLLRSLKGVSLRCYPNFSPTWPSQLEHALFLPLHTPQ